MSVDPPALLRPGRAIVGISAMFLPHAGGNPDWVAFERGLERTLDAGLVPAVNMDTGFVDLLDEATRREVVDRTASVCGGRPFVAGAFVDDGPRAPLDVDAHRAAVTAVAAAGATPVVFPSFGLRSVPEEVAIDAHRRLGDDCDRFIAFELSPVFNPSGRVYSLEAWDELLAIGSCIGAKHSSLSREAEWERLLRRDRLRPDFHVFTGNDLAIDMVMYGSDYLLGLAAFAPDVFAARDRLWAERDPRFHEVNDALQALGSFAFRDPVPAYKSSAAQFLHLRGWAGPDAAHPSTPARPEADVEVLRTIGCRLGVIR